MGAETEHCDVPPVERDLLSLEEEEEEDHEDRFGGVTRAPPRFLSLNFPQARTTHTAYTIP